MAKKVEIEGADIRITDDDYICITDLAKTGQGRTVDIIRNYFKNRNNLEVLYLWEELYNPNFKRDRADTIKENIHRNDYVLSVKQWIEETGAIGVRSKAGRYGGTYAHQDIATDFARWLKPKFALWLIKEFNRLKKDEAQQLGRPWSVRREIAKANYKLHIDAVNKALPPNVAGTKRAGIYFASEADLLNTAVFGMTAKTWRQANPKVEGNIRDHATTLDLLILSNLEVLNAKLIEWGSDQEQRIELLTKAADEQRVILADSKTIKKLK